MEEDIKVLKEVQWNCLHLRQYKDETAERKAEAIKNILNELERLQKENEKLISDNLEYQRIQDIFDKRTYRKKYLEERRKEQPNLLYPDADEIYQRYYELKQENEELKIDNNKQWEERCRLSFEVDDSIPKQVIKDKIEKLKNEFDFYAGREHAEWQDGEFDGDVCDDLALQIKALKELLRE